MFKIGLFKSGELQSKLLQKSMFTVNNKTINIQHEGEKCKNCIWQDYCARMAASNSLQLSTLAKNVKINIEFAECDYYLPSFINGKTDKAKEQG